jgi:hypothetical protein
MNAINEIHNAARTTRPGMLDRQVFLDTDLELYGLADLDLGLGHDPKVFINVPLKNVISLGRRDFWEKGETWREVALRLHGTNWGNEIFQYFESDLAENPFPAPESASELRLMCIGGVCECGNGNHRLVAAKNWLASKYGDDAHLKQVKVKYYPIRKVLKELLSSSLNEKSDLLFSSVEYVENKYLVDSGGFVDSRRAELLLALSNKPHQIYVLSGEDLFPIKNSTNWFQRLGQWLGISKPWYLERQWKVLPVYIIDSILDDEWITQLLP